MLKNAHKNAHIRKTLGRNQNKKENFSKNQIKHKIQQSVFPYFLQEVYSEMMTQSIAHDNLISNETMAKYCMSFTHF
jgi:hypothetical protein